MKIEKYYDRLTADERFRLLQAALSRNDNQDYEHLTNSAPLKKYSMRDADVGDRLDAAETIALRFSLALCDTVHWIERSRLVVHILETPLESAIERWDQLKKISDLEDRRWATLKAVYYSFKE